MNRMEDKLKILMSAGAGENRTKWANEWQKEGKKVIGVLDSLVPEEVIYAAGMLPWHIHGTWQGNVSRAMMYRMPQGSSFLSHVLESVIEGELDFLNGMAYSNRDEDFMRFRDYWEYLGKADCILFIEVPLMDSELTRRRFTDKIREFIGIVEKCGEVKIDDESLRHAITVYDKGRALLRKMYELRKKEVPPLSGAECLAITTAAMVMPRDEFNRSLEELLPYLETREANISHTRPRLLLSSDMLDNPAYINLVEETGCLVAMDDMDTGSRYFWESVDSANEDPAHALAKCYLQNQSPRMINWAEQAEQLARWADEFHIDGVLDLHDINDYTRGIRQPFLERRLKASGVPVASFVRDYHLANVGQLKTRIGTFLEMLGN
jgi:benzoyl-CoA reductase/2-hydroxyglutaryl-CoA dehydratase subunit BcrC/BadD/HgdB